MKNEIDSKYYIFMAFLCALFFACGYKVGDSSGYKDGYNEGYRYDCKEEIASIYKQVKSQSKFLDYSDSMIRQLMRESDSLKHKEYYQKKFQLEQSELKRHYDDSVKYAVYAKRYNDSIAKVVGWEYPTNFILDDGRVNVFLCDASKFSELNECLCWRNSSKKKDVFQFANAVSECENYVRDRFGKKTKNIKVKGRKK